MKVALCLYGHFRTFEHCWPGLKEHLLDRYDVDVFASAWLDSTGDFHPIEWEATPQLNAGWAPGTTNVPIEYVQTVLDRLKPKDVHFDQYWLHEHQFSKIVEDVYKDRPGTDFEHRPKSSLSQNFQRHIAISLKRQQELRQGWNYDAVICTRYDIEYTKPIVIEDWDLNVLTVPNRFTFIGTDDIWGLASSQIMDVWGDQINNIDALRDRSDFYLQVHQWLFQWLEYKNIKWQDTSMNNLGIGIRRNTYTQY